MAYDVPSRVREGAATSITDLDRYRETYARAADDPNGFWLNVTKERIRWRTEPTTGLTGSFHEIKDGPLSWFSDGTLNVTESCLDRHLEARGDHVAILWEGDQPGEQRTLTYAELHREVCKTTNALRELGLKRGERAIIYMGMVPEAAIAMLACARIGAIHSVVFGGFSAEALREPRPGLRRGDRDHPGLRASRARARSRSRRPPTRPVQGESESEARARLQAHRRRACPWDRGRAMCGGTKRSESASATFTTRRSFEAEHPLFILYTSGSTGRPKGVVHTCGGYLTYASYTHATVFDRARA